MEGSRIPERSAWIQSMLGSTKLYRVTGSMHRTLQAKRQHFCFPSQSSSLSHLWTQGRMKFGAALGQSPGFTEKENIPGECFGGGSPGWPRTEEGSLGHIAALATIQEGEDPTEKSPAITERVLSQGNHLHPVHDEIYEILQSGVRLSALTLDSLHALKAATIIATLLLSRTTPVPYAGQPREEGSLWGGGKRGRRRHQRPRGKSGSNALLQRRRNEARSVWGEGLQDGPGQKKGLWVTLLHWPQFRRAKIPQRKAQPSLRGSCEEEQSQA
ncbi:hypothetical protein E2320_009417 [Naja naja]|nr:hypothetical protein E2320_009417 [Naja naja]